MKTENSQQNLHTRTEVLIALAVQSGEEVEQPPNPEELTDFFANSRRFSKQRQDQILAYLDSHPQAYDRWIKQGEKAKQPNRPSFMFSMVPYAITACAALLIAGVVLLWRGQAFQLDQAIDHASQMAFLSDDHESLQHAMASLTDSLKQSEQPLSFSQSGKLSLMAQAFLSGLQHDLQTPGQQPAGSDHLSNAQQEDYQLGRWHTLLWTVSQQNKVMPANFWREQLKILNHLQAHYAGRSKNLNTTEISAVALQLERLQTVLRQLVENNQVTKLYRQLEQTLTALRYGLIPLL